MKSMGWVIINRELKERIGDKIFDSREECEKEIEEYTNSRLFAGEVFY